MERIKIGITETELKTIEHNDVLNASNVDRKWWAYFDRRFKDSTERDNALQEGKLVKVEIPNEYFTCPSDIRKDVNLQLLRPSSKELLFAICRDLDLMIGYSKSGFRLAVTSLYRSDELQEEIANSSEWYRAAVPGTSSHAAGAAFDISIRSHYFIDQITGQMKAVNNWDDNLSIKYQPLIFESLGFIISSYAEKGYCNLIVENIVEANEYWPTCFHVCVSPNY